MEKAQAKVMVQDATPKKVMALASRKYSRDEKIKKDEEELEQLLAEQKGEVKEEAEEQEPEPISAEEKTFKKINEFVANAVKNYCLINSYDSKKIQTVPTEGWLNIYKKGDSQEYHTHSRSVISAVYFLKLPKHSSKLYFKPPFVDMIEPDIIEPTFNNMSLIEINPKEGSVIVFRSYLPHMVSQHNNKQERISLAYNFYNV